MIQFETLETFAADWNVHLRVISTQLWEKQQNKSISSRVLVVGPRHECLGEAPRITYRGTGRLGPLHRGHWAAERVREKGGVRGAPTAVSTREDGDPGSPSAELPISVTGGEGQAQGGGEPESGYSQAMGCPTNRPQRTLWAGYREAAASSGNQSPPPPENEPLF